MRLLAGILGSLVVLPLFADQITVKNGDRITGSIVKKDAKSVIIKSEIFGEVTIPWGQVQTISADEPINVVLATGETIRGTVTPHQQTIQIESEDATREVVLSDVTHLRNAEQQREYERLLAPGLTELWTGSLSFGFAGTQGNARTRTLTTSASASRATRVGKTKVYFNAVNASALIENVAAATARAVRGGWSYSRNVTSSLFINTFNDYEFDRFQFLDLRVVFGGGLGYTPWKAEHGRLDIVGGGAWNRESFAEQPEQPGFSRNSGETYFGNDFNYALSAVTTFYQNARIFPNLSNTGEYRLNFDLGANTKLTRWLDWNVAISNRFLSNPVSGRQNNDLLYSTGIGVSFSR